MPSGGGFPSGHAWCIRFRNRYGVQYNYTTKLISRSCSSGVELLGVAIVDVY